MVARAITANRETAEHDKLRAAIAKCDPTQTIKRRMLERRLLGIRPVGPTDLHPTPRQPTETETALAPAELSEVQWRHGRTVKAELDALDRHAADVERRLSAYTPSNVAPNFAAQEMAAELIQLRELRRMLQEDYDAGPVMRHKDSRQLTGRDRALRTARADELRQSLWDNAARADKEGDYRNARRWRVDALRARLLAEDELGWRSTQPGYGMSYWN